MEDLLLRGRTSGMRSIVNARTADAIKLREHLGRQDSTQVTILESRPATGADLNFTGVIVRQSLLNIKTIRVVAVV